MSMLPGVGIFGSDPISKILIQLLKHFRFEIHAIWTNHYEVDSGSLITDDTDIEKFMTTSIDNVLLNKNINLVFVCCQPNFHSKISSKALGIGKNVICLSPTCKNVEEIIHMINSAYYYPSLVSSVSYGGFKYLSEYKIIKESLSLIGEIKLCNIVINCQNLPVMRNENSASDSSRNTRLSNITASSLSINWLADRDLGAGVLNRFGASMISLILNLFDDKKVTKVFGSLRTFIEDLEEKSKFFSMEKNSSKSKLNQNDKSHIRKITADDHCTFQMCLEPNSLIVNVVINSLAQCKYSQEIVISGNEAALVWKDSNLYLRSHSNNNNSKIHDLIQKNAANNLGAGNSDSLELEYIETDLNSNDPKDIEAEDFLKNYKNFELKYPELPFIFVRGLYHYIAGLKEKFKKTDYQDSNNNTLKSKNLNDSSLGSPCFNEDSLPDLENFEHTRIVQEIIKDINLSSESKRWVTVNY